VKLNTINYQNIKVLESSLLFGKKHNAALKYNINEMKGFRRKKTMIILVVDKLLLD